MIFECPFSKAVIICFYSVHFMVILTRNMRGGFPIRAIAVDNFLLFPPERVPEGLLE